ncbi:hypothetical protein [Bradyrhizobium sp. AS23.2]|uniref:hypothetical protein n=1 Tax=Bradyrhizobium sp. AS23.2 TaxID=1680155 RepID=UPI0014313867|nr:hypothetical protein [Bradyrhizobium sp. AS23.2]
MEERRLPFDGLGDIATQAGLAIMPPLAPLEHIPAPTHVSKYESRTVHAGE